MAWVGVVTNAGQALLSSYAEGGHSLSIDGATVGSGVVAEANLRIQTAVADERDDASIVSVKTVTDGAKYEIQVGPTASTAYTAHQIGLWASLDDGESTLILLAQDSGSGIDVPVASGSPKFAFSLMQTLAVDNTGNLTVNIDESAYVNVGTLRREVAKARPRGFRVIIGYSEWDELSDPNRFGDMYYYDIEDASITVDTCVISWSFEHTELVDIEYIDWEASDGKIRISAPWPGTINICLWVEEQLDGLPFGRIYSIPLTRYDVANNLTTTAAGYALDARQGKWLNDNKEDKLTWDTTPTPGSTNPVTSGGTANAIAAVTPVIYDKVITGVSVSTDGGYSAAIPYSTIGSGITHAKIISCFLWAWSADAILVPQPYTDGLYIYSTKAFTSKNVNVRIVCLP